MLRYALPLLAALLVPGFALADAPKEQSFYQAKDAFEIDGNLAKVERHDIVIARPGHPEAKLDVSDQNTKITLDGKEAKLSDLKPGTEVRAKFQLSGGDPVAVQIEAKGAASAPTMPAPAQ